MGNPMGFYLSRMPDGTWLGIVPGLGDLQIWRETEERRRLARELAATRPSAWVRLMNLLRSGLDSPRTR